MKKKIQAGAVPIPIHRNVAALILVNITAKEISAVQVAIKKRKTKTWAEIGAVPTTLDKKKTQARAVLQEDEADDQLNG